jgi:hypothetical protein
MPKLSYAAPGALKPMLSRPRSFAFSFARRARHTVNVSPLFAGMFGHSMDEYSQVIFEDLSG